ncbi:hypothetical protein [Paracraurococcus ruber]|uniref:Lipoprotein n=1 Tax=Paracraurococcus ruber TaxID=77675 RepID=A0ABS1CUK2_9PROT|nr:hypothetical protein [Paracraurococcus ruber]MBK1658185.1 hypothetical protein [Paracraurococcus ruber]TDG31814.1 hypothetical protein E2C05_09595 [Paracraurococcus ruber]
MTLRRLAWLLPLLAACAAEPPMAAAPAADAQALAARATGIGGLVRAAQLCGIPLSQQAQDRAARIEAAAIALHQHRGGMPARDGFLREMAPPGFEGRRRTQDRAAWCAGRRGAVESLDAMLNGPEGTALMQQAEAAEARLR